MRVLILYTELAGYVLACVKHYLNNNSKAKILLVHYPINSEAPFTFNFTKNLTNIEYNGTNISKLNKEIESFNPQIILCSGWGNKYYLSVVKKYYNLAETVVCFDNQWQGNIKQYILKLIAPFWLKKIFKKAWVPGEPQKAYALKLGFNEQQVFTGFYVANTSIFEPIGAKKLNTKRVYPKTMISIARYIAQKDLPTLWAAFIAANSNTGNQWQLHCLGLGTLFNQKTENEYITHFGFVQPAEMEKYLLQSGIYVLPSQYEPWGVAVQEAALAALPLVLSNKIGASSMFLNSSNGFEFEAGNTLHLQNILEKIMQMPDSELWQMAENSYKLGNNLTLQHWADTLNKIGKQ